ncbi:MAG TPA: PAS domain-containing protein, partial [Flavisolibacter sp.]|nr:PAS domain-containing protein [Flavisolibacter sp.]
MEEVYSSETLLNQLCEHQPEAISWLVPVYQNEEKETVIDFEVRYCNLACSDKTGLPKDLIIGQRILREGFPDPTISELKFKQCLRVFETGEPVQYDYFSTYFDRYFSLSRVKVQNGILVTSRDLTNLYLAEQERNHLLQEKQQQLTEYSNILDTCSDGIITLKSIRNNDHAITDFRITQCNKAGLQMSQLPGDAIGKHLLATVPRIKESGYADILIQVVETGKPFAAEIPMRSEKEKKGWYMVTITRLDDGVVV